MANIHHVAFIFENGCFVVVNVEIVWCRENRHDRRETGRLGFAIHPVTTDTSWVWLRAFL